jgi:hypothetical protein
MRFSCWVLVVGYWLLVIGITRRVWANVMVTGFTFTQH